jgi:hypothetical protein
VLLIEEIAIGDTPVQALCIKKNLPSRREGWGGLLVPIG